MRQRTSFTLTKYLTLHESSYKTEQVGYGYFTRILHMNLQMVPIPPPSSPIRRICFSICSFILLVRLLNDATASLDLSRPYVESTDRISGEWLVE